MFQQSVSELGQNLGDSGLTPPRRGVLNELWRNELDSSDFVDVALYMIDGDRWLRFTSDDEIRIDSTVLPTNGCRRGDDR